MIGIALQAIFGTTLGRYTLVAVAGVLIALGGLAYLRNDAAKDALREREIEVREQNNETISNARDAADSFLLCDRLGRMWDWSADICRDAGPH